MKKLRLLFLNHNVAWRGSFFRGFHWGRHLVRRGHHVTLLTISENRRQGFDIQERDGVHLVKSPDLFSGRLRSGWDPWDTLNRLIYLWPKQFDLIHSVDSRPVCILPAIILKKHHKTKLIIDWLDWWGRGGIIADRSNSLAEKLFEPVETFFEEGFRHLADGSVVISSALKKRALSLGVGSKHLIQIPFGADIERLQPRDKIGARRRLGLPLDQPLLGYVGNIMLTDREFMRDTFRHICQENERVRLLLIGNCPLSPGEFSPEVSHRVFKTNKITYEDLQDYLAACDVLWLPIKNTIGNRGRWPSKIADYLAAGRPVAACAVGDLTNLFSRDAIGILSPDIPRDFAEATLSLLDRPDLEELGRNARQVAERELSWDILTDKLEGFYSAVLSQS